MVSRVIPVDPFDLVIFGGTGDLARRKILPGLYRRYCAGQMPEEARIIGAARTEMDAEGYREMVSEAISEFGGKDACGTMPFWPSSITSPSTHVERPAGASYRS